MQYTSDTGSVQRMFNWSLKSASPNTLHASCTLKSKSKMEKIIGKKEERKYEIR